jgi:hypothetical protein
MSLPTLGQFLLFERGVSLIFPDSISIRSALINQLEQKREDLALEATAVKCEQVQKTQHNFLPEVGNSR